MFTKALIFILLGTSFVLATPLSEDVLEQQQVDKTWREKVSEFLHRVETVLVQYYNKGKENFEKVLSIVKQKNKEIAEIAQAKWTKLQEKYQDIKDSAQKAIEEKKKAFVETVQTLKQKGHATEKVKEYAHDAMVALREEYTKFKVHLQEWLQNVKKTIADVKQDLEVKPLDTFLVDLSEQVFYAAIRQLTGMEQKEFREHLLEYDRLKEQAKAALIKKMNELREKLKQLIDTAPTKYKDLKSRVSLILSEEKDKWESLINKVKQKILAYVKQIKDKLDQKGIEHQE